MSNSVFDPHHQHNDVKSKITAGLERLSEVFRVLLWEQAKKFEMSPLQIQLLIFVAFHRPELCHVSHLADEFNVTKPTVSDAVRVLEQKGLIDKVASPSDRRSYRIVLTEKGQNIVNKTADFAQPVKDRLGGFEDVELHDLFKTISSLIFKLNKAGILRVQRTCLGCRFYQKTENGHYCNLLEHPLLDRDLRIDCAEFEDKAMG